MVTEDELAQIQRRMAEAGITNAGAYMRKMALNGYILHVDLAPVKELVSLQRRCANNLNQVAIHANTFGVYPEEIAGLQRDYEKLWDRVSDVLAELSVLVENDKAGYNLDMAVPCLFYFRYFSRIISLISALLYPCRANNLISSKYLSNDSAFSTNMRLVCAKISKNSK